MNMFIDIMIDLRSPFRYLQKNNNTNWKHVLETYWLLSGGSVGAGWVARVQARNEHGWGALSPPADLDAAALAPHRPPAAALALALLALLALLLAVAAGVFYGTYINTATTMAVILV